MKKHFENLRYIVRHKMAVFRAGRAVGGIPLWRLLLHDWSKFTLAEWGPYADHFYPQDKQRDMHVPGANERFDRAWLHHLHHNPHHWQYWILQYDEGGSIILPMPEHFAREMVADWIGAGAAQGHRRRSEVQEWYESNKFRIVLHEETRALVEALVDEYTT